MAAKSVLIIGGGASGLAAALVAARRGARVTLLDKNDRVGKKLLATGNGRCNLANTGDIAGAYFGDAAFASAVLNALPARAVLRFFESVGVPARADAAGRVYPACNQAAAVLDALRAHLTAQQVRVITGAKAQAITPLAGGGFSVQTAQGAYEADSVLACCGGLAAPKLGASDAYGLLTRLGCALIPPAPALAPLDTDPAPLRGLSGLRLPARLTLCEGAQPFAAAQGEVLFADYGVSGVCAMQLARDAYHLLHRGAKPTLYIDFSPALGIAQQVMARVKPDFPLAGLPRMQEFLQSRANTQPAGECLTGALPRVLREKLAPLSPPALAKALCAYPLCVTGVRGFEQAQVTQGGIDTRDFCPQTLACRHQPGLYACGEMLNVDGDCGGFNLMFAFATGLLAGAHAAAGE